MQIWTFIRWFTWPICADQGRPTINNFGHTELPTASDALDLTSPLGWGDTNGPLTLRLISSSFGWKKIVENFRWHQGLYLFDGRRPDFANAVDVVVQMALVVAAESFRPQIRPAEMSVRIVDAFNVRPFTDQSECHVKGQVLQLVTHLPPEGVQVDSGRNVRLRISVKDVTCPVLHGVQVGDVASGRSAIAGDVWLDVKVKSAQLGVIQQHARPPWTVKTT